MGNLIKWWKHWSIWRVFLILLGSIGICSVSAYFLPHPWGLVCVLTTCLIAGILIRIYGPDAIIDFFKE